MTRLGRTTWSEFVPPVIRHEGRWKASSVIWQFKGVSEPLWKGGAQAPGSQNSALFASISPQSELSSSGFDGSQRLSVNRGWPLPARSTNPLAGLGLPRQEDRWLMEDEWMIRKNGSKVRGQRKPFKQHVQHSLRMPILAVHMPAKAASSPRFCQPTAIQDHALPTPSTAPLAYSFGPPGYPRENILSQMLQESAHSTLGLA